MRARVLAVLAVAATLLLAYVGSSVSLAAAVCGVVAGASIAYGLPEVRVAVLARPDQANPRSLGGIIIATLAFLVLVLHPDTWPAAAIAGLGAGIAALVVFTAPPATG